jgi:hypothetical protein
MRVPLLTAGMVQTIRERFLHERREIYLVWLWLLDSIPPVHLRSWWQKETRSRLLLFFDSLLLALDTFNVRPLPLFLYLVTVCPCASCPDARS